MLPYITRRILASIPVLIVLASLTFFLLRLVPGDPATLIAGHEATPEDEGIAGSFCCTVDD